MGENVVVTFSEAMNKSTAQAAFSLKREGTTSKLGGSFSWDAGATVMTFNPNSNLLNTDYNVDVTGAARTSPGTHGVPPVPSVRSDSVGPRCPVCRRSMTRLGCRWVRTWS